MYLPHHFAQDDLDATATFVEAVGAADLVTFDGTRPLSSRVPVLWDRSGGPHGRLLAHLARANPQWGALAPGAKALAVVTGPQAYVSPTWYASKAEHGRVVPTWNYEQVHLTGELVVHDDPEWLLDLVTRLTARHEAHRAQPWAVTDAPERYLTGQLRAIVGVELLVEGVEDKRKLSQNRSEQDRAGVARGLRQETTYGVASAPGAVADAMARNET